MILLGQDVLAKAGKKNKPLRTWLRTWAIVVQQSRWNNLQEVRRSYPSADGVAVPSGNVVTVFNVKGGHYRLLAMVDYDVQVVEVLEVPTHSEYDKNLWKARY